MELSLIIAIFSSIVSLIALIYTVQTYILKRGHKIRASYSLTGGASGSDEYISSITLENLKDRPIVIFNIFMRVGHGQFLEIASFEAEPLIVRPFEVFQKTYDPIVMYSMNMKRMDLNGRLAHKLRNDILVGTSEGKVKAKGPLRKWHPLKYYWRNPRTIIAKPERITYKGKAYGSNVRFIIDITGSSGKSEIVSIHSDAHKYWIFNNFLLTEGSLASKANLIAYLKRMRQQKLIHYKKIEIVDFHEHLKKHAPEVLTRPITPKQLTWIEYHIKVRIATFLLKFLKRKKPK